MKPRVLVVGLGEVGKPIYELLVESGQYEVYGYDIDKSKTVNRLSDIPNKVDILHVAFPYTNKFINNVLEYMEKIRARSHDNSLNCSSRMYRKHHLNMLREI